MYAFRYRDKQLITLIKLLNKTIIVSKEYAILEEILTTVVTGMTENMTPVSH